MSTQSIQIEIFGHTSLISDRAPFPSYCYNVIGQFRNPSFEDQVIEIIPQRYWHEESRRDFRKLTILL